MILENHYLRIIMIIIQSKPNNDGSDGKESACNAGDLGSILGSGRSPGEQNGNTLQYSCLENPMDRGAWWATVHGSQRVRHDLMTRQHSIYVGLGILSNLKMI